MPRQTPVRLRLAASYVAFTALVLTAAGFFFWRYLKADAEMHTQTALDPDWGATVGYLHFDNARPEWQYDRSDPEEADTVKRLRHVFLLADQNGNVLESSTTFASVGLDTPQMRVFVERTLNAPTRTAEYSIRKDKGGTPYLIRAGWTRDDHDRKYFLAIGRSLAIPYRATDRFLETYFLLALLTLLIASWLSWWLTGVAIQQGRTT